ncbi:MAG: glycoside hydrolase family 127 protein [Phycisphaerales bacterium]|nr:MAG: glycoside hydrolase family 127 protein [Phycisphaerales bacterium]
MYNAGHFFEMAIEHNRLTGQDKALNAAKRFADHIDNIFGPGKRYDVGGHEEIELAPVKLYRATGDRKYLELSRFLLDERGHAHGAERKPFDPKTMPPYPPKVDHLPQSERRTALRRARWSRRDGRMQDHKPLVDQHEAVGHAVRAGYVYSAMTDIVRFMDAPDYERAIDSIWNDVVGRKMYVNGGVGTAQYRDEGFGDPYLLPNRTYCESCASIAHVLWQHRMNLLRARQACRRDGTGSVQRRLGRDLDLRRRFLLSESAGKQRAQAKFLDRSGLLPNEPCEDHSAGGRTGLRPRR